MKVEVRLMELLAERGKTIYWLSKQLGVDYTTLYRLRDGVAKGIRFELLGRICEVLNCELGDLLVLVPSRPSAGKRRKSMH